MPKTVPCLWFDTQGEEAARFYCSVFPNSTISGVTRYPEGTPGPVGSVMTVDFELDGQPYTALNGGPQFTFSEAISFQIDCADQGEIDYYWDKLGDGGDYGPCGWLKDRFGLSWQVFPFQAMNDLLADPDSTRGARGMQAMLGMSKIDIAEIQRAAYGG